MAGGDSNYVNQNRQGRFAPYSRETEETRRRGGDRQEASETLNRTVSLLILQ